MTRQPQLEQPLHESERRFRLLTNGIPHMVWLADGNGHIEFLNRQFTLYTGTEYEPIGAPAFVEKFVHPDDVMATINAWKEAIRTGRPFKVEQRILSASGHYRWFAARAEPHFDEQTGEVLCWLGTMTDIHNQKVAEENLQQANRQKDEFLAMLAHELRNPLAAIRNVTGLLEPKTTGDADAERYMGILRRQTSTLCELVNELLDVSRITRGLIELKREHVPLADIVNRSLESVQEPIERKGHQLSLDLPRGPLFVMGDPVRLEQILVNLLTNAAKYTDPGGRIALSLTAQGDCAKLRVRDSGIGLAPDAAERIFTLFGQAERGLDRAQGGLGIGLTIARNLAKLHEGNLKARSEGLGKGAEFIFTLPLAPAEEATAIPGNQPKDRAHRSKRLLLVEDSPDVADTLALLLRGSGHQVTVAHDGPSALARAGEVEPELILLDIGLPGMDGYELAQRLHQNPHTRTATFVALTGYGQPRDRSRAEAAGFDAHFVKPVDFRVLEDFVDRA